PNSNIASVRCTTAKCPAPSFEMAKLPASPPYRNTASPLPEAPSPSSSAAAIGSTVSDHGPLAVTCSVTPPPNAEMPQAVAPVYAPMVLTSNSPVDSLAASSTVTAAWPLPSCVNVTRPPMASAGRATRSSPDPDACTGSNVPNVESAQSVLAAPSAGSG